MSQATTPEESDSAPAVIAPAPTRRAWGSMLLGLLGVAGAGLALALLLPVQDKLSAAEQHAAQANEQLARTTAALTKLEEAQQTQQKQWEDLQARLSQITDYTKEDWLLAESAYLTDLAAVRLQTLHDVPTALKQLENAQARLATLHDPNILPLKESLAQHIQALKKTQRLDWEALWVELGTVSQALESLPLDAPGQPAVPSSHSAPAPSGWREHLALAWSEVKSLIRVRHIEESSITPLVTLQEQSQLIYGLQFIVEEARWAVIQQNPTVYEQSIALLQKRLGQYFDQADPQVRDIQQTLSRLQGVSLSIEVPDLSGLAREFQRAQHPQGGV